MFYVVTTDMDNLAKLILGSPQRVLFFTAAMQKINGKLKVE